jgi:dienelactone hydrolase
VTDRFSQFPSSLAAQARLARLGPDVPALLVHPDWSERAPVMLWMHGRTVNKELDPGRYLRWMRAGIATCAIDLPGHGERFIEDWQGPERTLDLIEQAIAEIDPVLEALAAPEYGGAFDLARVGIGGMSAGGMVALRRLCDPHEFTCASVEATTGSLERLYKPDSGRPWLVDHPTDRIAAVDPMQRLSTWTPLPLLVLHSRACARFSMHSPPTIAPAAPTPA